MSGEAVGEAQRLEVLSAINQVVDPCSVGIGVPIGVVDMGLVESVNLTGAT
jgi:hypothetical protein